MGSTNEYNTWASLNVWNPLPEQWAGAKLARDSDAFATEVRNFQQQVGLIVDGKLGPDTWDEMQRYQWEQNMYIEARGVDIARWQGDDDDDTPGLQVSWDKVAAEGYKFAIIKATEGVGYNKEYVTTFSKGCKEAGLLLNYYHYGTPHTLNDLSPEDDATEEAKEFTKTILGLPSPEHLRFLSNRFASVWLDLEEDIPPGGMSKEEAYLWCKCWLEYVEDEGFPAGLYTSKSWLNEFVQGPERLLLRKDGTERPFWVPRYGKNPDPWDGKLPELPKYDPNAKVPGEWGAYDIWQFSSKAVVSGVEKQCDINTAMLRVA